MRLDLKRDTSHSVLGDADLVFGSSANQPYLAELWKAAGVFCQNGRSAIDMGVLVPNQIGLRRTAASPRFRDMKTNASDLGYSSMDVVSGAGHDAVYVARVAPQP